MRQKRAVLYDDNPAFRSALKRFLERQGYEVVAGPEPVLCTIYESSPRCDNLAPCSDILLTDNRMPKMTGIELLTAQTKRGCALTARNKAVISADVNEDSRARVRALGCEFFDKPIDFDRLKAWLAECESRMDLERPLGEKRRDAREACSRAAICRTANECLAFSAEVVNCSVSGICIRAGSPPAVQQTISLESDQPLPSNRYLVRWTKDIGGGQYLAGMSCG